MKLDVLRRYREQLESVVRMDLFLLRRELQDAEARAHVLDADLRRATDVCLAKAGKGMPLEDFWVWQSMVAAGMSNLEAAKQAEGHLREAWSQKQDELRQAMQDRRTIDRLAERIWRRRQLVQERIDQSELDEAARRTTVM